jgi:hypothetical protein
MTTTPIFTTAIDMLIFHTDQCDPSPTRDDDSHDDAQAMMRDMIIDENPIPSPNASILETRIHHALNGIRGNAFSNLALFFSLCPMHLVDYAICFDDNDVECIAIRECFPDHDT